MVPIIQYRHNMIKITSISGFANVKGGYYQNCKDVYFIRALGKNDSSLLELKNLHNTLCTNTKERKLFYTYIIQLPILSSIEESNYYSHCYTRWIQSDKKRMETYSLKEESTLSEVFAKACAEVVDMFCLNKNHITDSIIKNFVVKLLFWYDFVMADLNLQWHEKICMKIVAENILKEQEYFFFYLLTLIGADVLLMQTKADIQIEPAIKNLSLEIRLGEFDRTSLLEVLQEENQNTINCNVIIENNDIGDPHCLHRRSDTQGETKIKVQLPERKQKTIDSTSSKNKKSNEPKNEKTEKSFEELAQLASSIVMITVHNKAGDVLSTGSGIMISSTGYILTNHHVITGGAFFSIRIEEDDTIYTTDEVIKYHSILDLALLRIHRNLTPIPIYKGKQKLVRGQKVIAIGSPLGLFNSVSDGIISGFRTIDNVDMIQFTAPISHGSSGGAVLNMNGEVIGISTAGIDRGQNINLAVGYENILLFIKGFDR